MHRHVLGTRRTACHFLPCYSEPTVSPHGNQSPQYCLIYCLARLSMALISIMPYMHVRKAVSLFSFPITHEPTILPSIPLFHPYVSHLHYFHLVFQFPTNLQ